MCTTPKQYGFPVWLSRAITPRLGLAKISAVTKYKEGSTWNSANFLGLRVPFSSIVQAPSSFEALVMMILSLNFIAVNVTAFAVTNVVSLSSIRFLGQLPSGHWPT